LDPTPPSRAAWYDEAAAAAAVSGLAGDHPCRAEAIRENAGTVDANATRRDRRRPAWRPARHSRGCGRGLPDGDWLYQGRRVQVQALGVGCGAAGRETGRASWGGPWPAGAAARQRSRRLRANGSAAASGMVTCGSATARQLLRPVRVKGTTRLDDLRPSWGILARRFRSSAAKPHGRPSHIKRR
jgi:hypothetical protein